MAVHGTYKQLWKPRTPKERIRRQEITTESTVCTPTLRNLKGRVQCYDTYPFLFIVQANTLKRYNIVGFSVLGFVDNAIRS
jgi:hypothetical protein